MTLLDQHIRTVRAKLGLGLFVDALATTLLVASVLLLLYVVVRQFTSLTLPREVIWLFVLLSISASVAAWIAKQNQPDSLAAAVAIDERLGLKEKFSTALHARHLQDPFSQAAVRDAEQTAGGVDLHQQFPLHWPRRFWSVLVVALLSAAVLGLIRPRNLFSSNNPATQIATAAKDEARERAKETVEKAIATIDQAPKAVAQKASLQLAKAELQDLLKKPDFDPANANRKALSAMQQLQKEMDAAKQDPTLAEARRNEQQMASLHPDTTQPGAVAEAHKDLSQGKFDAASQKLDEAVKNFDKMNPQEKAAASQQMQKLADQLKTTANDQQNQQRLQKQMQQLGMNEQQQKEARQALEQAAKGDQKAAAKLQQLAKETIQKSNNGNPPTPQQEQQMQQNLQQMQAQTNNQQQQKQLSEDTTKLAQDMQQTLRDSPQQSSNAQQQSSQQSPQQQANAQQQSQDMQKAMADAKQQMQKMQAQSQAAKQAAQSGQGADQAAADAENQMNGPPGQKQGGSQSGQGQGASGGQSTAAAGSSGSQSWGMGHGQVLGNSQAAAPPANVDKAISNSENTDLDHVLASSLIKSDSTRGESHAQLQSGVKAAAQQATEEVDTEHVGREGQKVVHDYFGALGDGK